MKVLFITPFVPYEGIPHAGGYFLYKYLYELHKRQLEIHMLAPNSKENKESIKKVPEWIHLRLAEIPNKTLQYKIGKVFKLIHDPLNQLDNTMTIELKKTNTLNNLT